MPPSICRASASKPAGDPTGNKTPPDQAGFLFQHSSFILRSLKISSSNSLTRAASAL